MQFVMMTRLPAEKKWQLTRVRENYYKVTTGLGKAFYGTAEAVFAERELDLEKEIKILEDQDIIHGIRHQNDLDESVSCYKDINKVFELSWNCHNCQQRLN